MRKFLFAIFALFSVCAVAQVAVQPILQPHVTFVNSTGAACAGCSLYTYAAGTTTPLATYTDSTGTSQNTNPIILDASGGATIWPALQAYKYVLKDTTGATLWTVDNVSSGTGLVEAAAQYCFYGQTQTGTQAIANCVPGVTWSTGGNVALNALTASSTIAATGAITSAANVASMLLDKGGAVYNVKAYGAVGDGSTDDTADIQAAITASNGTGCVYFPADTYSVSNLSLPSGTCLLGSGFNSQIKANSSGSSQYLIASKSWLTASSSSGDGGIIVHGLNINANNLKGSALVLRAWNSDVTDNWIYGSTGATTIGGSGTYGADLLLSASGQDGTALTGSLVNGHITENRFGWPGATSVRYNLYTYDPTFAVTDWILTGNWLDGESNAQIDAVIADAAGWLITRNHFYAAKSEVSSPCIPNGGSSYTVGCDLLAQQTNYGGTVANNYFEDSVGYDLAGPSAPAGSQSVFGPGNIVGNGSQTLTAYFVAAFGNGSGNDETISKSNKFENPNGGILHDYSGSAKNLYSQGDNFAGATPITLIGAGHGYTANDKTSASGISFTAALSGALALGNLASDPASPGDGSVWYNTTSKLLKGEVNGAAVPLATGIVEQWANQTLCTPTTSTDASCTGTFTFPSSFSFADTNYGLSITAESTGGAFVFATVTGKTTTTASYAVTCTFNCGTYGTLTFDILGWHP